MASGDGIAKEKEISRSDFPDGFVFGVATSAYQIEGARSEDGRGDSIWDVFAETKGNIKNGSNGDIAVDHYHRYKEDVKLMAELGFEAYRFSISWSRIFPDGLGTKINEKGISFYNSLIDFLLEKGIQPYVTLYHWDLPQNLHESMGGWLSEKIVEYFAIYAETCFASFGDRVKHWITINEPLQTSVNGYCAGIFAPGRHQKESVEPFLAAHYQILSHATAVDVYRRKFKAAQGGEIGLVVDCEWAEAFSNKLEDKLAAERRLDFQLGWYLDPIFYGQEPRETREDRAEAAARTAAAELAKSREGELERERLEAAATEHHQGGPGVIGSIIGAARHAKEAIVGKGQETSERAGEHKHSTAQTMGEYEGSTAEKAGETKDATAQKAKETKDATAQKMGEHKDSAMEKAKETKDSTAQKMGEYKDSTAQKVGEYRDSAMHKTGETKDSAMQKVGEYRDTAAEKARETKDATAQKMGEYKDSAAEKARETKDATAQKIGEYKDSAMHKAGETKDSTMQKARETKDSTAEKARDTKDSAIGKVGEYKDAAAEKARSAVDYLTGKKEETKGKAAETAEEAKERMGATEESTRQKMEGLKLRAREDKEEAGQKAGEAKETAMEKGREAKGGILSSIGNVAEAIKEKFSTATATGPKETVEHRRYVAGGGPEHGGEEADVAVRLKQSEQMHGQTFNDVGQMEEGEEGGRRGERHGKM